MSRHKQLPVEVIADRANALGITVPVASSGERYLTPNDIGKILNVTGAAVKLWIVNRRLPATRAANGFWRVNVSDFEAFLRTRHSTLKKSVFIAGAPADATLEITRAVEALGHQAVVPSNYTDAVLKTVNLNPSLFIIDVGSAQHDPWKLAKKVRTTKAISKIPILLVSSSSLSEADTDLALKLSIQGFFNLATESSTLTAEIGQVLSR